MRLLADFAEAMSAETMRRGMPMVPQTGTLLRWYRDCEMAKAKADHDVDLGVYAVDWDKVDFSSVWRRTAWASLMRGELRLALFWLTGADPLGWGVQWLDNGPGGVRTPLKMFMRAPMGGPMGADGDGEFCDIDIWVLHFDPRTNMTWRCDQQTTYRYGPSRGLQRARVNGVEILAPDPVEQAVEDSFGAGWRTPMSYATSLAQETSYPKVTAEAECATLVAAFEGASPCTCYSNWGNNATLYAVIWRWLMLIVWCLVPVGCAVGWWLAWCVGWCQRAPAAGPGVPTAPIRGVQFEASRECSGLGMAVCQRLQRRWLLVLLASALVSVEVAFLLGLESWLPASFVSISHFPAVTMQNSTVAMIPS